VQGHDLVGRLVQPLGPVTQFFMGAAALFTGVGGELDAVNSEHAPPDQSLGIAGQPDLTEQGFDLGAEVGDELGNVGMAGLAITANGDELDVALARLFNRPAGDESLAIGQQNDLEHDAGVIGTGAHRTVLELVIHGREVELIDYQIVQCEGKTTGDDLFRQHDRQQHTVAVLGFVAGHAFDETFATHS